MLFDGFFTALPDIDPQETEEWVQSYAAVVERHGKRRGRFLIRKLMLIIDGGGGRSTARCPRLFVIVLFLRNIAASLNKFYRIHLLSIKKDFVVNMRSG